MSNLLAKCQQVDKLSWGQVQHLAVMCILNIDYDFFHFLNFRLKTYLSCHTVSEKTALAEKLKTTISVTFLLWEASENLNYLFGLANLYIAPNDQVVQNFRDVVLDANGRHPGKIK